MSDPLWYVHKNDVRGGWAIMAVDLPPSQARPEDEVATFVHEEDVRELVEIHNSKHTDGKLKISSPRA